MVVAGDGGEIVGGAGAPRDRGGGVSGGGGVMEERGGEMMSRGGSPGGGGQDCGGDASGSGGGRESSGGGTESGNRARILGGVDLGIVAGAGGGGGDDSGGCQVRQSKSRSLLPLQELETGVRVAKVSKFLFCLFLTHCSIQCQNRSLMPGVCKRKDKMCDDKGGVTERSGGDGDRTGTCLGTDMTISAYYFGIFKIIMHPF